MQLPLIQGRVIFVGLCGGRRTNPRTHIQPATLRAGWGKYNECCLAGIQKRERQIVRKQHNNAAQRIEHRHSLRPIALVAALLAFLLPILACNFPTAGREPAPSVEEARQTLVAEVWPTLLALTPSAFTPQPFQNLATATPPAEGEPPASTPSPPAPLPTEGILLPDVYLSQSGDTLAGLVGRFQVPPEAIVSPEGPVPQQNLIQPGMPLVIPRSPEAPPFPSAVLPDSEIVYGPSAADFDIAAFVEQAGGFLSSYTDTVDEEVLTGSQVVRRVSLETSVNPRILLAFLEYRAGWVYGEPRNETSIRYPLGFTIAGYEGLYKELSLSAKLLNIAYYAWRTGAITELRFPNGTSIPLAPELNAGSIAVQYIFSRIHDPGPWQDALYGESSFLALHSQMYGDPWQRASLVEPLFPAGLEPLILELPFRAGEYWSFTGGPHIAWNTGTPMGALDFAPVTGEAPCRVSRAWATAAAPGLVVRSDHNIVMIDLDGDGYEQTGWVLMYYHIAEGEKVPVGTWVNVDDWIGHPSCEGGNTTGTHVHFTRKYNGEWVPVEGMVPWVLSGFHAYMDERPYQGRLIRGDQIVEASPSGARRSLIYR